MASSRYCQMCGGQKIFEKPKVNHILHMFLTIFTVGLWSIMWILIGFCSVVSRQTCTGCGHSFMKKRLVKDARSRTRRLENR